ncbi:hypothetical protein [Pararhodobacter oceanensis]|uniref:hypothetical protein n=1 Tax=Pararhodobacter oceanensis TaxID=2172121 RepID=UPI003A949959
MITSLAEKGAENLLRHAAGTARGDHILILHEPAELTYYDPEMVDAVVAAARRMGAKVSLHEVPFDPNATTLPAPLVALMRSVDQTVFLARVGDQLRFSDIGAHGPAVISYALDAEMLGSPYGTADHRAFQALCHALNTVLAGAKEIRATCPLGTDFTGPGPGALKPVQDVGLRRFPMPVFAPLPAKAFSGRVALPGFLLGTGSRYYQPYGLEYEGALFAEFSDGRITGFSGAPEAVASARKHYDYVAHLFDIDRDFVHSWHAGINPGCGYGQSAAADYERWGGAAFGNPRLLHFHTCGAYAPGEISWNVVDPTIIVDGVALWEDGVLNTQAIPGAQDILDAYPCARASFAAPDRRIGLSSQPRPSTAKRVSA